MKKQFYFILLSIIIPFFISAQESDLPKKGKPVKYGKYLLYMDSDANEEGNSTQLNFGLYDNTLKKVKSYQVNVDNMVGKYCSITYVFDQVPASEWIEISLREKLIASSTVFIRLDAGFKIAGRYNCDYNGENSFNSQKIELTTINYIPLDHSAGNWGTYGFQELDARTSDGSLIYLNYDESNNGCAVAMPDLYVDRDNLNNQKKLNKESGPSTLCYFQTNKKDYTIKWKLDLKDRHIVAYRVYAFGNDLFLYTSYFKGESSGSEMEQMLRKIDINSGELIYEVKLNEKPGFELMLSNAYYDNTSKNLILCGNYITALSEKERKKVTTPLSSFFIGKINVKGECSVKEIEINAEKPEAIDDNLMKIPFLSVKQLVHEKDGLFVAAGQYNYQLPIGYGCAESPSTTNFNLYEFFTAGLFYFTFDNDLNVKTQETSMIEFSKKKPVECGYYGYIPEVCILGTKGADNFGAVNNFGRVNSNWDEETQSIIITQIDMERGVGDKNFEVDGLKVVSGKKEYFKPVAEIPYGNYATAMGTFILDSKTFLYWVEGQYGKTDFDKGEL
jgi:hypothetical protein